MAQPQFERPRVDERYFIGPDNAPIKAESRQQIRAIGSTLTHVPYLFDTNEVTGVTVTTGGTAGEVHHVRDKSIYGVDIELTRPLEAGKITHLAYTTLFRSGITLPNEFRRHIPVEQAIKQVGVTVVFDEGLVTDEAMIWEATWDMANGEMLDRTRVEQHDLKINGVAAHGVELRQTDPTPGTMIGFQWELPN